MNPKKKHKTRHLTYDTSKVLKLTSLCNINLKCVEGRGKGIFRQTKPLKKLPTNPISTKFWTINIMLPENILLNEEVQNKNI